MIESSRRHATASNFSYWPVAGGIFSVNRLEKNFSGLEEMS